MFLCFLSDHPNTFERIHQGILGTRTDYDIPFEQLNIKPENGRESERLKISKYFQYWYEYSRYCKSPEKLKSPDPDEPKIQIVKHMF